MLSSLLEWARILLITAFAGTIATLLLPEGGLKGYVKLAAAAVTAAVVAAPIAGLFGSLRLPSPPPEGSAGAEAALSVSAAREAVANQTALSLEEAVKNIIYEKSGINCRAVNIYIQKDKLDQTSELSLEKATIDAGGDEGAVKAAGLPEYLRGMLGCEVEFTDGGEGGPDGGAP